MVRVRISTTVDSTQLERCRGLLGGRTSEIVDRALLVLAQELEHQREVTALEQHPYEEDVELAWSAPPGPDLPYDGSIPDDVRRLAESRRKTSGEP